MIVDHTDKNKIITITINYVYRVALRVRPLTEKEHLSNCTECISFIPNEPQILIGKDHSFTYDYIFDTRSPQQSIYEKSVVPLTEKFVEG
jgi:Pyruvate/2-oxoacid:ferredoxin oxidoreductase delta subunit